MKSLHLYLALTVLVAFGEKLQADSYSISYEGGVLVPMTHYLDNGGNTLNEVLTNAPAGSSIFIWNGAGYDPSFVNAKTGLWDNNHTFEPGQGAWFQPGAPYTAVFNGIALPCSAPLDLVPGQKYFRGRQTYGAGTFENITGISPQQCDAGTGTNVAMFFSDGAGGYIRYAYQDGRWLPEAPPLLEIGGAVFLEVGGVCSTNRIFEITACSPSEAPLCTNIQLSVWGSGFTASTTNWLERSGVPPIWPQSVAVDDCGSVLAVTYDLSNATDFDWVGSDVDGLRQVGYGSWNVVVEDPVPGTNSVLYDALIVRAERHRTNNTAPWGMWEVDCEFPAILDLTIGGGSVLMNNAAHTFELNAHSRAGLGGGILVEIVGFPGTNDATIWPLTTEGSPSVVTNEQGQALQFYLPAFAAEESRYYPFSIRPHVAASIEFTLEVHCSAALLHTRTLSVAPTAVTTGKFGPVGYGAEGWVAGFEPFNYQIVFSNDTGSASSKVVIRDELSETLDLTSLTPGTIMFGTNFVMPDTLAYTSAVSGVTVSVGLQNDVQVSEPPYGTLMWTLESATPFLAVGEQGSVSFSAIPGILLNTGDVVTNEARIEFEGAPIQTVGWGNTIDKTPPASVLSIIGPTTSEAVELMWSGSDVGSGLSDYTIFADLLDGWYWEFLHETTNNSALFPLRHGRRHSFYSQAKDHVGNIEPDPGTPDAIACGQGLAIDEADGVVRIHWCQDCTGATLEWATDSDGPYTNVIAAPTNPHLVVPGEDDRYYRLLCW
jgi:hypothetical protein